MSRHASSVSVLSPITPITQCENAFVDIADVFERNASFAGSVIVGEINVHMDDASSADIPFALSRFSTLSECVTSSAIQNRRIQITS